MKHGSQTFGGTWTEEKLERVRKYLAAYSTIMAKQKFRFAYIDVRAVANFVRAWPAVGAGGFAWIAQRGAGDKDFGARQAD